ncbi:MULTISPECIES: hypothetical protein [unclassified Streptomyces]|uniref:hypothetical protein n=1 Tax=unclassified Streptomyces TaxID=2593676 RepID=UPI00278C7E43|nr:MULTISPECIES: hypothetical protein [unclassified Streptomyces]
MRTVFSVHYPTPTPTAQDAAAAHYQRLIKVRGGGAVHIAGTFPDKNTPEGQPGPSFTLYEDVAGQRPICSVAARTAGAHTGAGTALAVTGPDGIELGVLRLPARGSGGRRRYEVELPDGTSLVGRSGTISAWILYVLLSPLLLIYNVASLVGGYGRPDWHLPSRTAWRPRGGLGPAPLKFFGMTDKYKARTSHLDLRVAYAQAVLHEWDE